MPIPGQDIQYGPWTEGVRYDLPPEDISAVGIRKMENVRLTVSGAAEKRLGTLSYKSVAAISGTPTFTVAGEYIIPGGATKVFAAAAAIFYEYSSGWVNRTGSTTLTAGDDNTWEWAAAFDNLVLTNGVDTDAIKWSGSGNATVLDDDARFTQGKHLGFWDNRLWIGNVNGATDKLWYSDAGDIETWGATSFYLLGAPITAIAPMQNALAVHTESAIHAFVPTGNATIPYQLQQRTSSDPHNPQRGGSISGRGVVSLPGDLQVFPMDDGIYMWDGGERIEKVSHALDLGYWEDINVARLHQSHAIYYAGKNEIWFWLPWGTSQTNMNHIMIMSTKLAYVDPVTGERRRVWFGPFTGNAATFERNCSAIIDNKPHAGTYGGKLLDHAPANIFSDETAAYVAYFESAAPAPQGSAVDLRWLYGIVYYDALGEYTVTIEQEGEGLGVNSGTMDTTAGGGALDTFELDVDVLGTVRMVSKQIELRGYDPQASLKISNNNANEPFRVRRMHPVYKPIGIHRKQSGQTS